MACWAREPSQVGWLYPSHWCSSNSQCDLSETIDADLISYGVVAAPMLMSSLQFAAQIVMAKTVLGLGIVKRQKPADLTWREFFVHGLSPVTAYCADEMFCLNTSCCTLLNRSRLLLVAVVPNGAATGLDIGLSNFSLSLITLSFYTMCKSTTPVFLLGFCFLWGIERCA